MKTLTIDWLNKCRCGKKSHTVKTARGNNAGLWDDDAVKCNSCGRGGVIQVCEGQARVLWETDEEMAEVKPMSNITKELLQQKIADMEATRDEIPFGLDEDDSNTLAALHIALASLEAEPVCVIDQSNLDYLKSGSDADVWPASRTEMGDVLLYRTAPPAPVSVPDLKELEAVLNWILMLPCPTPKATYFAKKLAVAIDTCRAAMLQGADRPQNEPQNIPENIPATQFKPVADLYGLTSPTGGETSFTFYAVEARDFIDGGWSCQEYVELGRFQEAMLQNGNSPAQSDCCPEQNYIAPAQDGDSPVLPDGWVACSERMPDIGTEIFYFCQDDGLRDCGIVSSSNFSGKGDAELYVHAEGYDLRFGVDISHWMPLPAAPQQEV